MKRSFWIQVVKLALIAFLLPIAARSAAQRPADKGRIDGVVVRAGVGTPVAEAQVTLIPAEDAGGDPGGGAPGADVNPPEVKGDGRSGRRAAIPAVTADTEGRFSFANLDAGAYRLKARANAYVAQEYGQRNASSSGTPIKLGAGQNTNVSLGLTPAGNISGRILDRDHQPLAGIPIQLLRPTYDPTEVRFLTLKLVASTNTNDRGDYRLFWISPGTYYLRAGNPPGPVSIDSVTLESGAAERANVNPVSAGRAYFPGPPDFSSGARSVELTPGADLTGMNWILPAPPPLHRVRVRIVDSETGKAPPQARVVITPAGGGDPVDIEEMTDRQISGPGSYDGNTGVAEFRDLAPGTYTIEAMITPRRSPGPSGLDGIPDSSRGTAGPSIVRDTPLTLAGSVTVTVADADIDGVIVTLAPAGSVHVQVRYEGAPPPESPRSSAILMPAEPSFLPFARVPMQQAIVDGAYWLRNVAPNVYRIRAFDIPQNGFVKEARLDGVNILNNPVAWSGGAAGTLDVLISTNGGRVQGLLGDDQSSPVPHAEVALVPDRNRERRDLYKVVATDAGGRFVFSGVAPGSYKIFAWDAVERWGWFDPNLLERWESRGAPVSVAESATENIDIRIITVGGGQ